MTVLTQGLQPLEFMLSEASSSRARDQATVTVAGSLALPSGTVLGRVTATGKMIRYLAAAIDGSQTAVAILGTPLAGVNGDYKALVFSRDCGVILARLNGGAGLDAAGQTNLRTLGFALR